MKAFKIFILCLILFQFANCATALRANLEDARFALDSGDFATAVAKAQAAVAADPTNIEAARILGSAFFGLSGLDFLDLAEGLVDLQNNPQTNFQQIAAILPTTADLDDLRSAIKALEALSGINAATISDEELQDAAFDDGIMMIVEHFARGVFGSNFLSGTLDVTGITDADREIVLQDLLDFDNRLIASGVDPNESFIQEVRQTFCILEPLSSEPGFTTGEYQAFVGCQLSDDPATFDTTAVAPGIADCDVINPDTQDDAVVACYSEDTTL